MARTRQRSDAVANRERLVDAAAATYVRGGPAVPIAAIAAAAGVGVGTLYRHFPTRADLHAAVSARSLRLVLEHVHCADRRPTADEPAIAAIRRFLALTIADRELLVLPLHGGPDAVDPASQALRAEVRTALAAILARGRADGSIRGDVTPLDVIIAGAMLAQPLAQVPDWDRVAHRHAELYLAGIGPTTPR